MTVETHKFQAEVQQLLNLMIHSLYSNKEIFVRELVSNASDALDKLRFEELTNRSLTPSAKETAVRVTCHADTRRLVIEDNGIGMSRDEVIANLGTIANSGTKKFLETLSEQNKKDANLIGQFGVGFYSAFMVAERVIVQTCSAQTGESTLWESTGDGTFTLNAGSRTERGTQIEIVLKEDDKEFADDWRVKGLIQKYSNYVTYPILMADAEGKEERLNQTTPVWAKNKKDNKPEDYVELYKQISRDFEEPLLHEHISAEGLMPFQSVVFVPKHAPFDLYTRDQYGLHLYVKRVSITEKCKEVLPEFLRFISGVVETDELPLNVSREILQQNTKLPTIKKQITKKVLSALVTLSKNDNEKYQSFYETFGPVLKEGFHYDRDSHEALSELVRFRSSKTGANGFVSLKEYMERKAEGQTEIFYLTGTSFENIERSPHLEVFTSRGVEVLFMTDPVDEWVIMSYPKFNETNFKSIAKGDLDLKGIGKEPAAETRVEASPEELAPFLDTVRRLLATDIKDVKTSHRLTESACCLVAEENGMSSHLEKLLKSQNKEFAAPKKILEVNPSHPLIKNLANMKSKGAEDSKLGEWVELLYETALLAEGSQPKNPGDFAKKLTRMMETASHV